MELTSDNHQFGQLRSRIESTFDRPAMIVVTSAMVGDGKSVTAFGLAETLAEADHRVLFVDTNVAAPTLPRSHHKPVSSTKIDSADISGYATSIPGQRFKGVSFSDERFETGMSLDKVRAISADFARHFDYVIVDTSPVTRSNLAVLFATIANGVMLTLRVGRMGTSSDSEAIQLLARVGANVLGAMTITPKVIKAFRSRLASPAPGVILAPRHVTSRHSSGPEIASEPIESASRSKIVS